MKVAIIHDWLVTYAGAERVLEQMLICFPEADLFSIVDYLGEDEKKFIDNRKVCTSFIQKLPFSRKHYRNYLPLMPLAIEQFDLSSYDLILSSSHAVAKGVITGPNQLHISYIHSPIRYAWDLQHQYLHESGLNRGIKSMLIRQMLHKIRIWDLRTANGVDSFVANSHFISRRIWKVYRRKSDVIYPPVDVQSYSPYYEKEKYYLTASRMVPYKKIDAIVEAFASMPDKKLVVIGDGPDYEKIQTKATANIKLLGFQPMDVLRQHMQRARAFVFAAEEDFGITPVEAQACGTPVIAYGKGGSRETVLDVCKHDKDATGIFFHKQTPEAIRDAVRDFEGERVRIAPDSCRKNALRFSNDRFRKEFKQYVKQAYENFSQQLF